MKFALAKGADTIRKTKLSDFMLQEDLFDKLRKDFEIVQFAENSKDIIDNYIIDELPSPNDT